MNLRWSLCHRTGWRSWIRKLLLRPSKCSGSAKELAETLTFVPSGWSKMENTAPLGKRLEVKVLGMIATPVVHRRDLIVCNIFPKRFVWEFRNLWASKSIKHDLPNLETTTKMDLPQPQAGSSNISILSRRLPGAPCLHAARPRNPRWPKCRQTGWRRPLRKWLLRLSKCCGCLPKRFGKSSLSEHRDDPVKMEN